MGGEGHGHPWAALAALRFSLSPIFWSLCPPPPLPVYTSSFFFFLFFCRPSSPLLALGSLCLSSVAPFPPHNCSRCAVASKNGPFPLKVTFASERVSGRRGFSICVSTDIISTHFREEQKYIFSQRGSCGGRALLAPCVAPNWISNLLFILFYFFIFCSFCKQSKYSGERSSCVKWSICQEKKKALRKCLIRGVEKEWTAHEDVTNSVTCFIWRSRPLSHAHISTDTRVKAVPNIAPFFKRHGKNCLFLILTSLLRAFLFFWLLVFLGYKQWY